MSVLAAVLRERLKKGWAEEMHLIRNLIPTVYETSLRFEYKKICKFNF